MSRFRRPAGDDGAIMIIVVLTMLLITGLVTAGLGYAAAAQRTSRADQDRNAALGAAQAGIDDYLARLNRNDNYGRLNPFNDCANVAIGGPAAPTNSCGWTATTAPGWQRVSPSSPNDVRSPAFHYDVDATNLDASGSIKVTATGRSNGQKRTLQVTLARQGSQDFLYYTDHEDADPDNDQIYPDSAPMPARCNSYWWGRSPDGATNPRRTDGSGCAEITFIGGDRLDGKVHTNDSPLFTASGTTKPAFPQGYETSDPACQAVVPGDVATYKYCDRAQIGPAPGGTAPSYAQPLYLQDNTASFAGYPGCQYTGATRVLLQADGTMKVWSKDSTGVTAACGGTNVTTAAGATVAVPTDKVINVRSGDNLRTCNSQEIDGILPLGTYQANPTVGSYTVDQNMLYLDARCGLGNLYIEGQLKGRLTIAAQNTIVLTGDTVYAGGLNGSDLLGLVAGSSVAVMHPYLVTCKKQSKSSGDATCGTGYVQDTTPGEVAGWPHNVAGVPGPGLEVDAAIQSISHSFYVQSYNVGTSQGTLMVRVLLRRSGAASSAPVVAPRAT